MSDELSTTFLWNAPLEAEDTGRRARREAQQAAWLEAVGPRGWRAACDAAGVTEAQVHRWLRLYPEFKAAHAETMGETATRLESIVDAIAVGEIDATPAQVTLLQFRLRGLKPEVYRERSSVQVDQRTTVAMDGGEAGRARLMLAEWTA